MKTTVLATLLALAPIAAHAQTSWSAGGADIFNHHAYLSSNDGAGATTAITPASASRLTLRWSLNTAGTIPTLPTVEPGGLYFPDGSGKLYKVNPVTGAVIWSRQMSSYTGIYGSKSRSSPAIGPSQIVVGDNWAHDRGKTSTPGAVVLSVNKANGNLLWKTTVDTTSQWSDILGSPIIYGNTVYMGVTSWEEAVSVDQVGYVPSFRGQMVALDLNTGAVKWRFYTTPVGYTGVGSAGSTPVVWPQTNSLIFATGNNYTVPASVGQCIEKANGDDQKGDACFTGPGVTNYVDSVVAVDLTTGHLKWSRQFDGPDTWTFACGSTNPTLRKKCPYGPSHDWDFAQSPGLLNIPGYSARDDRGGVANGFVLTAVQKSGVAYGINPFNGGLLWSKYVAGGGSEWGSALDINDKSALYVATNNQSHVTNHLANGSTWNGGAWTSLNVTTGAIKWQVPTTGNDLTGGGGASAQGAVTFTNRVLLAGSYSGLFTARNAATGAQLWSYNSGKPVAGGPAVFNETIYWGTGYGTGGGTMFAFYVP